MDSQWVWGLLCLNWEVVCSLHTGWSLRNNPVQAFKHSLWGMRPSVGVHTGSCDLLPPSLDVCFDRTSFMPKTMPALCSSTPSGSSSEVGGSGGVFSQLPIQVLAAATMGPEVPQIKSCGLGGQETGKLTHADLSRPQLEVTSQSAVSSQSSG